MSKQRECSLSWAIQLCKEKGGRTKRLYGEPSDWYDKTDFDSDEPPVFTIEEITATWIYEEPEPPKTAFEIWDNSLPKLQLAGKFGHFTHILTRGRKQGWNAALDEAIELVVGGDYGTVCKKDLEHLKDK